MDVPRGMAEGETAVQNQRVHYLDWLRVLAIGGVFLFHAAHVFDLFDFGIKNSEQSMVITVLVVFFFLWGMPFFFLVAGSASWLALRRRSAKEHLRERFWRLFVPFLAGSIMFTPFQHYMVWLHQSRVGVMQGSFRDFLGSLDWSPGPAIFDEVGSHLWFLGFLFSFSLMTLPLFRWFGGISGRNLVSSLARLSDHRGAILLFILPLALVRLVLQPFFPEEHGWAAFFTYAAFFVLGYVLFADERFHRAIWRDWWISLTVAIAATLAAMTMFATAETVDPEVAPRTLEAFVLWALVIVNSWCWSIFMLFIGMRCLDFRNRLLQYGQEAVVPFYLLHQPVILLIAYFVVQWQTSLLIKLLTVILGTFVITIGTYEFGIRRLSVLRSAFGMKAP